MIDEALRSSSLWLVPIEGGRWFAGRPYGQRGLPSLFEAVGEEKHLSSVGLLHGETGSTPEDAIAKAIETLGKKRP